VTIAALESTWHHERRGYVRCRTIGHSWFDYDSLWTPQFGVPLTLRCERCGTERRDTINNRTGQLLARHYHKPKGYDLTKGEPRLRKDDFRIILMTIRMEEASRQAQQGETA
jgi:hypothetical protein